MLLEAQKGPESLQEALRVQAGNHRSQQDELRMLIDNLKGALHDAYTQRDVVLQDSQRLPPESTVVPLSSLKDLRLSSQKTETVLESLPSQLGQLEKGLYRLEGELAAVREQVETSSQAERTLGQSQLATPVRPERENQWGCEMAVRSLEETQRTLGDRIKTTALYNAAFTYSASFITISAIYLLLRGTG